MKYNKHNVIDKCVARSAAIAAALMIVVPRPMSVQAANRTEYTQQEIDELAELVHLEAGNQDEQGKRYVVSVVLNRIDDPRFNCDTIEDVIFAPNQFSTAKRLSQANVNDSDYEAVYEEIKDRSDYDIVYFNNGPVSGEYVFTHGGHNFGK